MSVIPSCDKRVGSKMVVIMHRDDGNGRKLEKWSVKEPPEMLVRT
jgi:hypothetical protein